MLIGQVVNVELNGGAFQGRVGFTQVVAGHQVIQATVLNVKIMELRDDTIHSILRSS